MSVLKRSIIWQTLFVLICVIAFMPISEVHGEEIPISVKAILPENQIDKNVGYYDLKVSPNEKQELSFQLNNQGDKDTTVNVAINPACTGDGGSFIYTDNESNKDPSMKYPLSSIATSEQTVSIPAKGSTITKIKLAIPSEPFEGVILGAIRVTSAKSADEQTENAGKGFNIVNNFAYSVAIQLRESDDMPKSDLAIKKVFATQIAGRNTVKINLQNPTPTIINEVSYEATISKKGDDAPLHENKVKGYRVAPNTNYNVPVSWENQPFTAGTYVAKVKAKSEETGQTWEFKQEFVISAKEARELNDKAVDLEKDYLLYIIIGAAVILVLVILLIILLVVLAKKRKKRRRQELARRKKKQKGRTNDKRNKRPAPKRADADRGNRKRKRR
jgi:Na+-transporting methylmalonyl-CoA/oxaloacetate decarboxylase gamma subunit